MRRLACTVLSAFAIACQSAGQGDDSARAEPAAASLTSGPRPQPKPGERVRQPELDGYCVAPERPEAFYYHGGRPVDRLAHRDGCTALYLSECDDPSRGCDTPREQEPGMWCCANPAQAKVDPNGH